MPMKTTSDVGRKLDRSRERCVRKYRLAKDHALGYFRNQQVEESLVFAQTSATFARWFHFGVWSDGELEDLLSAIGVSILSRLADRPPSGGRSGGKILYVATHLDAIGGHGEVLRLWLKLLAGKQNVEQYLLPTRRVTPAFLAKIKGTGCTLLNIGGETLTQQIESFVQQCLDVQPGHIFLFTDPDDVVAITAVGALKAHLGVRVMLCDHADLAFWLGKQITDVLVEFSPAQVYVSRTLRHYEGSLAVVPLTTDLTDGGVSKPEPEEARASTSSLSIASPLKIIPDGTWDYFAVIRTILERNPTHRHVLLTLPDPHIAEALRGWPKSVLDRLSVAYNVTGLTPYYRQADFLIETFPFSGGQVRVEAMAFGLPMIFVRNPHLSLMIAHSGIDTIAGSYPFIADSNVDVIHHAEALMTHPDLRRHCGQLLGAMFRQDFPPELVRSKLEALVDGASSFEGLGRASEMAGTGHVDEDYLLSRDLDRAQFPSPFLMVGRDMMRTGKVRFSVLFACLCNLMPEDWLWAWKRLARRVAGS